MSDQTPAQTTSDAPDEAAVTDAAQAPETTSTPETPEAPETASAPAPEASPSQTPPADATADATEEPEEPEEPEVTGTGDAEASSDGQASTDATESEAPESATTESEAGAPDAAGSATAESGTAESGTEESRTETNASAPTPTPAPPAATPTPAAPRPAAPASPAPSPRPTPAAPSATPAPPPSAPVPSAPASAEHPSPAVLAEHPHPPTPATPGAPAAAASGPSASADFGRVEEDGTVYVRTPDGERAVGSYPGATPEEALAYFARKYDEVSSVADLLYQRVTQTDLSTKEAADNLAKLREQATDIHAVGDLVALAAKVENIATALQARRVVEGEQRAAARAEASAAREKIVAEAEQLAAQPEEKVQWKSSSARMRALLDEWKAAQRGGPKLDRETEQALWQRLSASRNSFDKMRRVHFAQLGSSQAEAKAAKQELVAEAEALATSTDWGATAGAFKRLMDRWRQAGRASRSDDDALWKRFKAAQDSFFAAKDAIVAAENEEFSANLVVKQELLTQAQALLPISDIDATKSALRGIQEKWDAAGKVPRADMDRIEKAMRRVEQAVRDFEDKRWKATNPEVAARAASLASQAEAALERYRRDLEKAERSGDAKKIAKAREALEAREAWLNQARAGMAEFGG